MEQEKKKRLFPKRIVALAVLIATLSAAVYLNWQYTASGGKLDLTSSLGTTEKYLGDAQYVNGQIETTTAAANDFFGQSRTEREQTREKALETLREVAENAKSDEKTKQEAAAKISAITANDKLQSDIETLIKSKGFADCVAVITDNGINVIVKAPNGLDSEQMLQIQDIVLQNSKISLENIKIIEVK